MKKTLVISGTVIALVIALILFNKLFSDKEGANLFTQVKQGRFEIAVEATGELMAERSVDISGPDIDAYNNKMNQVPQVNKANQSGQNQRQPGGGQRGGGQQGGGQQGGGRGTGGGGANYGGGGDIRATMLKITDMVPEGTMVQEGDFIAQLDRTSYDNTLKDDQESLLNLETNLQLKILDTAVVLNSLRNDITNQEYIVSESEMTLHNSKYEAPDIIRQASIAFERAKRILEQKRRSYKYIKEQSLADIENRGWSISRVKRRVEMLQQLLADFTVKAPSPGMVIYMKDRRGVKRKAGSMITTFDRIIATLPDLSTMISKTYVNEIEISKVKTGQKVDVTIDAFPLKGFTGVVTRIANIGDVLPNGDSKVFETLVRIDGTDPALRPTMTTGNKIITKAIDNVVYIPTECVYTGPDNVPYVYTKNHTRQIVVTGESNDKNIIIQKGLKPGMLVYLSEPQDKDNFKVAGKELISLFQNH